MKTIRRCVLLNRDEETGDIEFRHYTIKVVPVGLSKGIKKIAVGKIPNLARFEDMTEFLASKGTTHILRKHFYSTNLIRHQNFPQKLVVFVKTEEFLFQHYILTKILFCSLNFFST